MQFAIGVCLPLAIVLELGHISTVYSCSACSGRGSTSLALADAVAAGVFFSHCCERVLSKRSPRKGRSVLPYRLSSWCWGSPGSRRMSWLLISHLQLRGREWKSILQLTFSFVFSPVLQPMEQCWACLGSSSFAGSVLSVCSLGETFLLIFFFFGAQSPPLSFTSLCSMFKYTANTRLPQLLSLD